MARPSRSEIVCVVLYLAAIVVANAVVSAYGQRALPFTAVCLIPFDLITRDVLHERWRRSALWPKMAALIATGSALSACLNVQVAVASFVAFAAAGFANAFGYWLMDNAPRFVKMNGSNACAAVVDSIVFPTLAFAHVDGGLVVAQAVSKFLGGLVLTAVYVIWKEHRCQRVPES